MGSNNSPDYSDIIHHPHHVSSKRPQMSRANRAAQFSPFAALTGYDDLVRESARITDKRVELSEDDLTDINLKLNLIREHISESPLISVIFFIPDPLKSGGEYLRRDGTVQKVKTLEQYLFMADGTEIPFSNIISITGELFKRFDGSSQIE